MISPFYLKASKRHASLYGPRSRSGVALCLRCVSITGCPNGIMLWDHNLFVKQNETLLDFYLPFLLCCRRRSEEEVDMDKVTAAMVLTSLSTSPLVRSPPVKVNGERHK